MKFDFATRPDSKSRANAKRWIYLDAPEFQRYVDTDAAKMADVVKGIGTVE